MNLLVREACARLAGQFFKTRGDRHIKCLQLECISEVWSGLYQEQKYSPKLAASLAESDRVRRRR